MAQRYSDPVAVERMRDGRCPECDELPMSHSTDTRFWMPRRCDLTVDGVLDRIKQRYDDDRAVGASW